MSETYRAIVRRVVDEIWNNFDLKPIDALYAPEFVYRLPGQPDVKGPDGYKNLVKQYRTAFPDLKVKVNRILVEGDLAAMEWTVGGTHKAELELDGKVVPPKGARIHYSGVSTFLFKNGKIAEESIMGDTTTFRRQLGVWPDTAPLEKLSKDIIEELFNKNRLELAEQLVTPDYVHHAPQGVVHQGVEGTKQLVSGLRAALPDMHFTIENLICNSDHIVIRWALKGTHQGEWLGCRPTGKPIMIFGTSISRVKDNKGTETWAYWDVLDAMHQMGAAQEVKVPTVA